MPDVAAVTRWPVRGGRAHRRRGGIVGGFGLGLGFGRLIGRPRTFVGPLHPSPRASEVLGAVLAGIRVFLRVDGPMRAGGRAVPRPAAPFGLPVELRRRNSSSRGSPYAGLAVEPGRSPPLAARGCRSLEPGGRGRSLARPSARRRRPLRRPSLLRRPCLLHPPGPSSRFVASGTPRASLVPVPGRRSKGDGDRQAPRSWPWRPSTGRSAPRTRPGWQGNAPLPPRPPNPGDTAWRAPYTRASPHRARARRQPERRVGVDHEMSSPTGARSKFATVSAIVRPCGSRRGGRW